MFLLPAAVCITPADAAPALAGFARHESARHDRLYRRPTVGWAESRRAMRRKSEMNPFVVCVRFRGGGVENTRLSGVPRFHAVSSSPGRGSRRSGITSGACLITWRNAALKERVSSRPRAARLLGEVVAVQELYRVPIVMMVDPSGLC